jgi:hypothetical protein
VQEDAVRFSEDLFGSSIPFNYEQNYPQNYLDSSSQMPPPYAYGGTSSVLSSQFTAPISSTPSTGVPKIQEADVSPSRSTPSPSQQPATFIF